MKRIVLLGLWMAGVALAHEGGPGEGTELYVPPPVEPIPAGPGVRNVARGFEHEVWLVDQSNTNGTTFGGTIHIYDGGELRRDAATATDEVINLSGATAALCMASTGANPVRPHMLVFNRGDTHAVLAFVASGHVVIFNAETRTPLACFRTEVGAGGFRQAHAVWPTPDNTHILVANQNGKKFERIATDYTNNVCTQEPTATLNLATCTTPNGLPCQDPLLRPDNAPICPYVPDSGFPAFLSLRGGGMLTVDPYQTPMQIIGEYSSAVVPRDGCGFIEARGYLYGNGGGGNVLNPDGWYLYRLPLGDASVYNSSNPPNTPAAEEIAHDDALPRDAHGVAASRNEKYVWFFDRAANVVEIYNAETGLIVKTENLQSPFSADPTPDLVGEAPDGKTVYASLRGPNPLSGDPHASTGSTPGLLVIEMRQGGKDLVVRGLAPITNKDAGGVERADGHGVRVRRTNARCD
jgi:hypothetical protein